MEAIANLIRDWKYGIGGAWGLFVSRWLTCPKDLLVWLSILLVLTQLAHAGYRFLLWMRRGETK
ncbi:MAG TPA: hypothetical protein DHV36_16205 [Desulfobacteraceae bacterium]|nr:hypothetical protein [Desulfobacteraceae bacterium]|tara:strand:+ start:313 stop:504 length:192 start_codon:yes stop_codon:yes gene_type:complete